MKVEDDRQIPMLGLDAVQYCGNGSTDRFRFDWQPEVDSDVRVYIDRERQSGGYKVFTIGEFGGQIQFNVPPLNGADIRIEHQDSDGSFDVILDAVRFGDHKDVEKCLAEGANVNAEEDGYTPLTLAVLKNNAEIAAILIKTGANMDARNSFRRAVSVDGLTALHIAAVYGQVAIVDLLLSSGAARNIKNNDGETPLHLAVLNGRQNVVELLVSRGARINVKNRTGDTPLMYAFTHHQQTIAEFLRKNGAKTKSWLPW